MVSIEIQLENNIYMNYPYRNMQPGKSDTSWLQFNWGEGD